MKTVLGVAGVVVLVVSSFALANAQDPPKPAPSKQEQAKQDQAKQQEQAKQDQARQEAVAHKIEILEQDLLSTRTKLEDTAAQLAETKAVLARTLRYLDAQAKSASAMTETLDQSEKAGFTFGINPESRQMLLAGWREQLAAIQKDVPVAATAPKTDAKPGEPPSISPNGKK